MQSQALINSRCCHFQKPQRCPINIISIYIVYFLITPIYSIAFQLPSWCSPSIFSFLLFFFSWNCYQQPSKPSNSDWCCAYMCILWDHKHSYSSFSAVINGPKFFSRGRPTGDLLPSILQSWLPWSCAVLGQINTAAANCCVLIPQLSFLAPSLHIPSVSFLDVSWALDGGRLTTIPSSILQLWSLH